MSWLDDETSAFLESGCALILGSVGQDGQPCAGRGWGLTVLEEVGYVRLLLDGDDPATAVELTDGARIAITAASVRTLEAVQLKGSIVSTEPVTPEDEVRADLYCGAMFTDIHETDFTPMSLLEELRPHRYVACTAVIEELFNQTPGPAAGERLQDP